MNGETNKPYGHDTRGGGEPPRKKGSVLKGVGILCLLHLTLFVYPVLFFFIGLVQIVYVVPAAIKFWKETPTLQGLLIGAGVTFLLNAACFSLVLSGFLY